MDARQHDRAILRPLAARQAEIAQLPIHRQTAQGWRALNDLCPIRAMVWINEIPWHEMDYQGELTLCCIDPLFREAEQTLRRTLYWWEQLPVDMIVERCFYSQRVVHDSGFGLNEEVDIAITDATSDILSRSFHELIQDEADLERIQMPIVTHDIAWRCWPRSGSAPTDSWCERPASQLPFSSLMYTYSTCGGRVACSLLAAKQASPSQ